MFAHSQASSQSLPCSAQKMCSTGDTPSSLSTCFRGAAKEPVPYPPGAVRILRDGPSRIDCERASAHDRGEQRNASSAAEVPNWIRSPAELATSKKSLEQMNADLAPRCSMVPCSELYSLFTNRFGARHAGILGQSGLLLSVASPSGSPLE